MNKPDKIELGQFWKLNDQKYSFTAEVIELNQASKTTKLLIHKIHFDTTGLYGALICSCGCEMTLVNKNIKIFIFNCSVSVIDDSLVSNNSLLSNDDWEFISSGKINQVEKYGCFVWDFILDDQANPVQQETYGVNCNKCGDFYPDAVVKSDFKCWSCRNGY